MNKKNQVAVWLSLLGLAAGCATSPTGRKQVMFFPESQMNTLGSQAFNEMKAKQPIEKNAALDQYVRCIATPLTVAAKDQLEVKNWEVVVFKDDSANAFALPGGKIGVHTGLLKVAKNDDQLAAVLGHEVGHVIARHSAERMSQAVGLQGGLIVAGVALNENKNRDLILGALGLGAQVGALLPWGRTQESEADIVGLDLMAQAGFNPRESVELWKNMGAAGGGQPPEFLSTHPSHQTRMDNLSSNMSAALVKYEQSRSAGRVNTCRRPSGY